jgi:hypothetical protein
MAYYTSIGVSLPVKPERRQELEGLLSSLKEEGMVPEYGWLESYRDMPWTKRTAWNSRSIT